MTETIPLVSVIIPMYNAAKYISQTLESLLRQTLKDFEVVIVDDCSTDNSIGVIENFAKRFGGLRLNVLKLATNSGTPGVPRNVAINFARGKYLAFLDEDDLFTSTALEEFVTLAEKNQADVINTTEFFCFDDAQLGNATTEELLTMNHRVITCRKVGASRLQQATEIPADIAERIKLWLNNDIHWATWATFCRRDFVSVNDIKFPHMPVSEDQIFNFACLCLSGKYLRVPNVTYIYREHGDSASHEVTDAEKYFHKWLSNLIAGFKELDKFMKRFRFFADRQDYRYAVLDWFFNRMVTDAKHLLPTYEQIHPAALNQIAEKEFSGDDATFSAYLFNVVNLQRLKLAKFHKQ